MDAQGQQAKEQGLSDTDIAGIVDAWRKWGEEPDAASQETAARLHREESAVTDDHQDRILEGCLREVLGHESPPDLTARILEALQSGQAAGPSSDLISPLM